jgi:hypothetical protein
LDEIVKRRQAMMRKAKKNKKDSSDTQPPELSDLLRQALQQPGVRELMAVYENWKTLEDVTRSHREAMGVKRIIIGVECFGANGRTDYLRSSLMPTWSGILSMRTLVRV